MTKFISTQNVAGALTTYNQVINKDWLKFERLKKYELFKKMVSKIPAYRKFLKQQDFDPKKIISSSDISIIPPVNKVNYFKQFPLEQKIWPEYSKSALVATSTSGSTGISNYFVRSAELDWQYSILAEYFLQNGKKGPTLLVDCFGMGVWIGGLITYQAFYYAANRGYPLTIITPGINKKEIFSALKEFAPNFENIIFTGYPPFLKDVVDEAEVEGINLKNWNCRFLFAAESFTENFREYFVKAAGVKDVLRDTLNIYGTAELGAMAFETPTSIFIRRLALKHTEVFNKLFGNKKIPTLCQYNPTFVSFDEDKAELFLTADGPTPFMRYKVGDSGGVYSLDEIITAFAEFGVSLVSEARKAKVDLLKLPFVYVFERNDFSTTLYGLQVYPQTIKRALEISQLSKKLTGKFTLETHYDKKNNQYLKINLELKPKVKASKIFSYRTQRIIIKTLLKENSEYRELRGMIGSKRTKPKLVFWPYNDNKYFKSGIKQQWLKK